MPTMVKMRLLRRMMDRKLKVNFVAIGNLMLFILAEAAFTIAVISFSPKSLKHDSMLLDL